MGGVVGQSSLDETTEEEARIGFPPLLATTSNSAASLLGMVVVCRLLVSVLVMEIVHCGQ
jgi:hypothetical protein